MTKLTVEAWCSTAVSATLPNDTDCSEHAPRAPLTDTTSRSGAAAAFRTQGNPGPSQIKVHRTTGEGHSRVGVLVVGVTVGVWASGGREEPEGRRDEHGDQKGDAEQEGPFDPRTAGPPLLER